MSQTETILILTPVKNAAEHLETYWAALEKLTYPKHLLSLGFLESDSTDGTFELIASKLGKVHGDYRKCCLYKRDYGFVIPENVPRYAHNIQVQRRTILARSRNQLLFRALTDEAWVLWLDVDVIEYPPDILETLLATGKPIIQPNCVYDYGGNSFDLNAWRDDGRLHMHDMRGEGEVARLDAVGGTMLLVRADAHRDGLVFPPFPYGLANPKIRNNNYWKGELETEGLGIMADDMGIECWAMPNVEIKHHR